MKERLREVIEASEGETGRDRERGCQVSKRKSGRWEKGVRGKAAKEAKEEMQGLRDMQVSLQAAREERDRECDRLQAELQAREVECAKLRAQCEEQQKRIRVLELRLNIVEDTVDWANAARRAQNNPPTTCQRRVLRQQVLADLTKDKD